MEKSKRSKCLIRRVKLSFLLLVLCLALLAVFHYLKFDDLKFKAPLTLSERHNSTKYIHFWQRPGWIRKNPFSGCPYKCVVTNGYGKRMNEDSDAVLFHATDVWLTNPPRKRQGQIWIFQTQEPPRNFKMSFRNWNNLFNWTMTYRRDADIPHFYGKFRALDRNYSAKINLKKKWFINNVTIAWFVSRCNTQSKREAYVNFLQKYHHVDIFGRCGTKKCVRFSYECSRLIDNVYKFYLSFESNLCRDYITEKLYKVFGMEGVMPVVRGNVYYDQYIPPGLYINTNNFTNIKSLVSYLKSVVKDNITVNNYFALKSNYECNNENYFCELCRRVHLADSYKRLYSSITAWEFGNSDLHV